MFEIPIKLVGEYPAWINIVVTIVTIFVSAYLVYFFNVRFNNKRFKKEFILDNLVKFSSLIKEMNNELTSVGNKRDGDLKDYKDGKINNIELSKSFTPSFKFINNLCNEYNYLTILLDGFLEKELIDLIKADYELLCEFYKGGLNNMKEIVETQAYENRDTMFDLYYDKFNYSWLTYPKINNGLAKQINIIIKDMK